MHISHLAGYLVQGASGSRNCLYLVMFHQVNESTLSFTIHILHFRSQTPFPLFPKLNQVELVPTQTTCLFPMDNTLAKSSCLLQESPTWAFPCHLQASHSPCLHPAIAVIGMRHSLSTSVTAFLCSPDKTQHHYHNSPSLTLTWL